MGATQVQVLTPLAAGAIAVVQVVGPAALGIAQAVFRPRSGKMVGEYPQGQLAYGDFLDGQAGVLDDGLALWGRLAEGGAWVEFHLHGGVRIVQRLVRRLAALDCGGQVTGDSQREGSQHSAMEVGMGLQRRGTTVPGAPEGTDAVVSRRQPSSFTSGQHVCCVKDQAFGWLCPLDRWVQGCLAEAATPRVVEWLVGQGVLWRQTVAAWRGRIAAGELESVRVQAEELLGRADLGGLWRGRTLAIVGLPNAGKSSIANRLAGRGVSLVADAPGTTRDWVGQQIALSGWPVLLVDTAGLRATEDPIEAEGVARAIAQARGADLRLLVVDSSCAASDSESWFVREVGLQSSDTIVYSKRDLPAGRPAEGEGLKSFAPNTRVVSVSCVTGEGWSELERALLEGSGLSALQESQSLVFCEELKGSLVRLVSVLGAREPARALAVLDDLAPVDGCGT